MLKIVAYNALNVVHLFQKATLYPNFLSTRLRHKFVDLPQIGHGKSFRRIVHYPEEYTVRPLQVTNLGGRDPVTGRRVVKTIGGGIKHKYHWIQWTRDGPNEDPPQEEKVLRILDCGCRTSKVALVAVKDKLKYILATVNMKPGDIIRTSRHIPINPVRPNEGDAYPLGALPIGTVIHNVQIHTKTPVTLVHSAGCFAVIKGHMGDRVIVQLPGKTEISVEKECMATVGRLSNIEHSSTPIGSAQKLRELGYRPRSGLKQKKTGRFGRKIKAAKPTKIMEEIPPKTETSISCSRVENPRVL